MIKFIIILDSYFQKNFNHQYLYNYTSMILLINILTDIILCRI